ncbi:MAG TPA: SDR family oxidoreductase [Trebonia sp.]|jgi:NAD(P)-dependent dehydrogenase (short-subunit alcohol dehydrogenase family)|nr:SDR family oxidoreductase [Trebonia sp.]
MRLEGKVGLITGAAGGIGSAAARAFAAEGAQLGLIDLPSARLTELAAELGDSAIALEADVSDETQVMDAIGAWSGRHDRADFLYVCAGRQLHGEDGPVGRVSLQTWNATIAANLTGAFLCVKHGIDLLCAAPSGSLIVCGSPTGLTMSGAGYAAYSASKAGMMSLARTTAADYAERGVRANVIVPGTTVTPLIETLTADPATRDALLAGTPLGRLGAPGDLTGIAVFLASDESRYATGATFCIDGGLTNR